MSKFLVSHEVVQKLVDGGLIQENPENIRRVVMDLQVGHVAVIYIEKFADDAILDVLIEGGLKVVTA